MIVLHSRNHWLRVTEIWLYNMLKHLPDEIENHILCTQVVNQETFGMSHLHKVFGPERLRRKSPNLSMYLRQLIGQRLMQTIEPDILHSHFGYEGFVNIGLIGNSRTRHIVSFYGWDVGRLPQQKPSWYSHYQRMFKKIDAVLCEGPFMAQTIIETLGCPPEKMHVYRLGIELDKVQYQPRNWSENEPLRVLMASTFAEKKGLPYALEALGHLQHEVELEITIIGDANKDVPTQQAEKARIMSVIEKYHLGEKTRLLGYQSHDRMLEEAYQHHLFLSPSVTASDGDTEGGAPVSIIEMAASGMPVVSTRHCDIPQVIVHGEGGRLTEERDVEGILRELRWLVSHPDKWEDMGKASRKRVEELFDVRRQGQVLADIYKQLL
jgi:colanic acid/amylovoran biosynthesis glycosyltransferase